jgi:superfamily II DNA or RNA helicase
VILRPYQQDALQAVRDALNSGMKRPLICIPTGGGKSPVLAHLVHLVAKKSPQNRILVTVHTQELIKQLAETYEKVSGTKPGIYSASLKQKDHNEQVTIGQIQSFVRNTKRFNSYRMLVVDECLPGETLVGGRPIKEIAVGDYVPSFDGKEVVYMRVVGVSKRASKKLVRIIAGKSQVVATTNHPVLTKRGWVPAGEVDYRDSVLRIECAGGPYAANKKRKRNGGRSVRQVRSRRSEAVAQCLQDCAAPRKAVLLREVRSELCYDEQPRAEETAFRTHVESENEPDGRPEQHREDVHITENKWNPLGAFGKDGEWARTYGPSTSAGIGPWVGDGDSCSYQDEKRIGISSLLQAGRSKSGVENKCRGRWQLSYGKKAPRVRREERCIPSWTRVENIEIQESPSDERFAGLCKDSFVYDLKIDETRCFFANGVLVHNCDRIPADGEGQYRTLIADLELCNPDLRIVGLTATPYRTGFGLVYGKDAIFEEMVYDARITELIKDGYLSALIGKDGGAPDLSDIHVRKGDYVASELEDYMSNDKRVAAAVREILKYASGRKKTLIFASGVKHANMVSQALAAAGINCPVITGEMPTAERAELIKKFKAGMLSFLVNINVLSIGFDASDIDMIVLLRPTKSPALYYQQIGRGMRIHEGKTNCLILDLAGNIREHGPVDTLNDSIKKRKSAKSTGRPMAKTCPSCQALVALAVKECGDCGHVFVSEEQDTVKHATTAYSDQPLSVPPEWHPCTGVFYKPYKKNVECVWAMYKIGIGAQATQFFPMSGYGKAKLMALVKEAEDLTNDNRLIVKDAYLTTTSGEQISFGNIAEWCRTLRMPSHVLVQKNGKYLNVIGRKYA